MESDKLRMWATGLGSIGVLVVLAVISSDILTKMVSYGGRNHHSCSHNNSNYSTESNYISEYKEKKNLLRKLADTNKNKVLDKSEINKMYEMCEISDKPKGYVLTLEDFNKGIENYLNY